MVRKKLEHKIYLIGPQLSGVNQASVGRIDHASRVWESFSGQGMSRFTIFYLSLVLSHDHSSVTYT